MLNKDGGVQADVTVSVLEEENAPSILSPQSQGMSVHPQTMIHTLWLM